MTEIDPREQMQQFASDNYAGICPEAWSADRSRESRPRDLVWRRPMDGAGRRMQFRELFETECEVYFVFNGTAANSLALASLCQSYHGVICCDQAHVETDECGAPEFFSNGSKLLVAPSADGKLTPAVHSRTRHQAPGYSLSQAARRHRYAIHRDRPRLYAGGVTRHLR